MMKERVAAAKRKIERLEYEKAQLERRIAAENTQEQARRGDSGRRGGGRGGSASGVLMTTGR